MFSEDTGRAASCAGSRTNLGTTRPTKSLSVAIAPLNDVYKYTIERGYILSNIRRDTATERIRKRGVGEGPYCPPKVYVGGRCVLSEEVRKSEVRSVRVDPYFHRVCIGGRCEFSEQEFVGGRCVTKGKEKTQPRTDDLSS